MWCGAGGSNWPACGTQLHCSAVGKNTTLEPSRSSYLKEANMCTFLLTRAIGAVDDLVDSLNMGDIVRIGKTDNDGRLLFRALGGHS